MIFKNRCIVECRAYLAYRQWRRLREATLPGGRTSRSCWGNLQFERQPNVHVQVAMKITTH